MICEDANVGILPEESTSARRGRILVVDDDRDQANVLSTALDRLGFDVFTAHDLQTGSQLIRSSRPQLILLDIRLPDGSGMDFCRELGDDLATCQIPVILLSGMEGPAVIRGARAAGCRYFLRKPYDPNALLLLVEDSLAAR